jgi:hypothetical protein
MPSQPDPLADQTVGVPTQPPAEAAPQQAGSAPQDATLQDAAPQEAAQHHAGAAQHYAAPQYDPAPQYGAPPQYAPSYDHHPYPQQGGTPYDAPRDRGALVGACLAFLVVVLGAPALVVAWRSAVGPVIVPSGLVGGLLAVAGLAVLAVGLYPLVTSRGEAQPETGPASLLRTPVVLALIGAILLVGAAVAV